MNEVTNKLSAGDIILFKGTSLLSRSIRFVMEIYRKKLGLSARELYNHAALIINYKNRLYVAEANSKGIEVNPFEVAYGNKLGKIKIISPKKAYSKNEKSDVSDVAIADSFNPTRYDFFNFIYQLDMVRRTTSESGKKWIGPKGDKAEKRLYCSEAVATWVNEVRPNTFNKPWTINPLDIDLNRYYKTIYNGIEA